MATLFNQYIPQQAGTPPGAGNSSPGGHAGAGRNTGPGGRKSESERRRASGGASPGGPGGQSAASHQDGPFSGAAALFSKLLGNEKNAGGLSGILQKLKLEDWDLGDLLLLGILLLLLIEGENTELVIALGLIIFLSL